MLTDLYKHNNNFDSAFKYSNIMYQMKDSLDIGKANSAMSKLELQHKLDLLAYEKESAEKQSRLLFITITGTLFLLLIIILLLYYRNRIKSKYLLLQKQRQADEKIRESEEKFIGS